MSVTSALVAAARHSHGGARSFPQSRDHAIQRNYGYCPSTIEYAALFPSCDPTASRPTCSAGWLMPPPHSSCHPVFLAHSLQSALWLLRQTLPEGALDDAGWTSLVDAAVAMTNEDVQGIPPSAQQPTAAIHSTDDSTEEGTAEDTEGGPAANTRKRTVSPSSPPTQAPSPKRVRNTLPAPSPEPSPPPAQSPVYVTSITNRNRRAEQDRTRRQAMATEKKRQHLGLSKPPESAEETEKTAYRTIAPVDEVDIAWIIKQRVGTGSNFFTCFASRYKLACTMLTRARAVGDQSTLYSTTLFLRQWRERGAPVPSLQPTSQEVADMVLSTQVTLRSTDPQCGDSVFQRAWNTSHYCEQRMKTARIEYRWAMALLGRAYANKIGQIQEADVARSSGTSRNRRGRGKVKSEAIDALLHLIDAAPTTDSRIAFRKRLARAKRWFSAVEMLGWGCLCLIPTDSVPDTWVEKDLHPDAWSIWLQLVKRVNVDAHNASLAFDNWVGQEGIQGGPIQNPGMLCIEQQGSSEVYEVEEIADSMDEQDDERDTGAEDSTQTATPSEVTRSLRQPTLFELFRPQKPKNL